MISGLGIKQKPSIDGHLKLGHSETEQVRLNGLALVENKVFNFFVPPLLLKPPRTDCPQATRNRKDDLKLSVAL